MYNNSFSNIISTMNRNNSYCQGAAQQMANGFYRVFEALELIATDLDKDAEYSSIIASIERTLNTNNSYCQGAAQQSANGTYRIVEMLKIIISCLEPDGRYESQMNNIINVMNKNDSYCQGAPQQVANGSYRIVEMLDILVNILAPEKAGTASSYISNMNRNNSYCQGAPQQSANGTDTAFFMLELIVDALDEDGDYSSTLSNIESTKARNNSYCQGADQQSANNIYRIMELIQVLGFILDAKEEARIKLYWEEHKDEYNNLMREREENYDAISAITKRADAVNADDKIDPIKDEIRVLENERNGIGTKELIELKNIVERLTQERAAISFFKFGLRKEAAQKIADANANLAAKQAEVNKEKNKVQSKIDTLRARISSFEKEVANQKSKIMAEVFPHQARIEEIDEIFENPPRDGMPVALSTAPATAPTREFDTTEEEYFDSLLTAENFPGYNIEKNVSAAQFDPSAHPSCFPISYLFYKDSAPALAVLLMKTNQYRAMIAVGTYQVLEEKKIPYIRFFKGYDNEEDYVLNRVREQLGE